MRQLNGVSTALTTPDYGIGGAKSGQSGRFLAKPTKALSPVSLARARRSVRVPVPSSFVRSRPASSGGSSRQRLQRGSPPVCAAHGPREVPRVAAGRCCRAVSRLPTLARTRCQLHGVRRETPTGRGGGGERQAAFYLAMSRPGPKTLLALDLEANENNPSNSMRLDQAEAFVRAVADVIPVGLAAGFAIQSAVRIGRSASANAQSCARRVLPLRGGSPSSCFGTAPTSRSRREIVATRGSTTRIVRLRPARMGA